MTNSLIFLAILCDLFGMVKWPFQWLNGLQIGDKKVTLNHLVILMFFSCFQCLFIQISCVFLRSYVCYTVARLRSIQADFFLGWPKKNTTFWRWWNLGVGIFEIELPDSWGGCWEPSFFLRNDLFFNLFRRAKIRPNIRTKMSKIIFNFKYFPDQNCFGRFHTVICFQKPPLFCYNMVTMIQFKFRYFSWYPKQPVLNVAFGDLKQFPI